ncbi:MAG: hypothetical protein WAW82_03040 [Candidatus Lutibacillus vidarii]|nr:hypothetical protein [Candidatus Lutibacillus vidarii]
MPAYGPRPPDPRREATARREDFHHCGPAATDDVVDALAMHVAARAS